MSETYRDTRQLKELFDKTKVKDVMITPVIKVFEDDDFSEAQQKFVDQQISHLIIVNHDNQLVGLLSQKYVYRTIAPRKIVSEEMDYDPQLLIDGNTFYQKDSLNSYILRNVMQKDPFALTPEDSLSAVLSQMSKRNISCIPIVDKTKKVCGIVTDREVLRFVALLIGG